MCFSGDVGRAVRRDRDADGEWKGRSPVTLLCCGRLFLLVTRRGPRTGLPRVRLKGAGETLGSEGCAFRGGSSPVAERLCRAERRMTTRKYRRTYTQNCAIDARKCGREERVQQAPVGIILSDRRWCEGAGRFGVVSGRTFFCSRGSVCLDCWCEDLLSGRLFPGSDRSIIFIGGNSASLRAGADSVRMV